MHNIPHIRFISSTNKIGVTIRTPSGLHVYYPRRRNVRAVALGTTLALFSIGVLWLAFVS